MGQKKSGFTIETLQLRSRDAMPQSGSYCRPTILTGITLFVYFSTWIIYYL